MANVDTVNSITDNLETVLKGFGIYFTREVYEEVEKIPASKLPHGQFFYKGESFEYDHGQKPSYAEIEFPLRVVLQERDPREVIRLQQKWVHLIRDGLTVNALNIDDLASSKLISRVTIEGIEVEHRAALSVLSLEVRVRYREL